MTVDDHQEMHISDIGVEVHSGGNDDDVDDCNLNFGGSIKRVTFAVDESNPYHDILTIPTSISAPALSTLVDESVGSLGSKSSTSPGIGVSPTFLLSLRPHLSTICSASLNAVRLLTID